MEELVTLSITQLEELMKKKLIAAGLPQEAASETAKHLAIADATGVHSHGAVRMDYYAERIAKGGITLAPKLSFEKTGPATGIFHGDNGMGQYVCNEAMKIAIHLAKEAGIAYVGVEQTSHSGTYHGLLCQKSGRRRVDRISDVSIRSNGSSLWRYPQLLWHEPNCICCATSGT